MILDTYKTFRKGFTFYPAKNLGQANPPTGHYTALIWKTSTWLGCGFSNNACSGINRYYACHMANNAPNINSLAQFQANVPQSNTPVKSEAQCCQEVYGVDAFTGAPTDDDDDDDGDDGDDGGDDGDGDVDGGSTGAPSCTSFSATLLAIIVSYVTPWY